MRTFKALGVDFGIGLADIVVDAEDQFEAAAKINASALQNDHDKVEPRALQEVDDAERQDLLSKSKYANFSQPLIVNGLYE